MILNKACKVLKADSFTRPESYANYINELKMRTYKALVATCCFRTFRNALEFKGER